MSFSLIASSQTTSIEIEKSQKEEIVKTLLAYPLALDEIKAYEQLVITIKKNLQEQKNKTNLLEITNNIQSDIINKEREKFGLLQKNNTLLKKQLKSSRLTTVKVSVVAAAIIGGIILIK